MCKPPTPVALIISPCRIRFLCRCAPPPTRSSIFSDYYGAFAGVAHTTPLIRCINYKGCFKLVDSLQNLFSLPSFLQTRIVQTHYPIQNFICFCNMKWKRRENQSCFQKISKLHGPSDKCFFFEVQPVLRSEQTVCTAPWTSFLPHSCLVWMEKNCSTENRN